MSQKEEEEEEAKLAGRWTSGGTRGEVLMGGVEEDMESAGVK